MMRYAAEISYDGSKFFGWQRQSALPSVQEALERALTLLNGRNVTVTGAGRTDAGVHARGQVCSFDMDKVWDMRRLLLALNANVPDGVSAIRAARTDDGFNARYSAVDREYKYFIWNSSAIYPHLLPVTCWIKSGGMDWERAAEACECLRGEHDFRSFCRTSDAPESTVRVMNRVDLRRHGNLITFTVNGNGFLTNMVRIMLGNLEMVAAGKREPKWLGELLSDGSLRADGGRTFPPNGLFLWKINYDRPIW